MATDAPVQMPIRPRLPRGWRWALFGSLALNVLFIGGLLGAIFRHGGPGNGPPPQNNLGAFVSTLPTERGQQIRSKVGDKRREMGPLRRELRQARDEALAALSAEPFDKDRFLAAQSRLIEAEHRQRLAQRDLLAEAAASMTADERRAFIRWRAPRRPPGGGDHEDGPPAKP